jgi:diguanylate cyclase (GGDEF)-like protein
LRHWLRHVFPAYFLWFVALLFAELAGWLQRPLLWLPLFAAGVGAAFALEFGLARAGRLRAWLPPATVRLLAATTLVLGPLYAVAAGARTVLAPLILLWFVPAAMERSVVEISATAVYAVVLDLGLGLPVFTATPVHPAYYSQLLSIATLAAVLFAITGIARYQRRIKAQNGWQLKQLAAAEAHVQALVTQDSLTRAFKRHYFVQLLRQEKARVDRYGGAFSICLLDIDRYEKLHESYGETVCAQVLRELAERVVQTVRIMDVVGQLHEGEEPVGRCGTTEFGLMLPSTGLVGAMDCAERLRANLESTPFRTAAGAIYVTTSVGGASMRTNRKWKHCSTARTKRWRWYGAAAAMLCVRWGSTGAAGSTRCGFFSRRP